MKIHFPAKITKDRTQKYFVEFPDLDEAITEGDTLAEALEHAADVLTLTLEGRMDEGLDIPHPSRIKGAHQVAPSARVQAALLIRLSKGQHTTAEMARKLGTSWPAVARLEDPHHWPSLRQLEKLASAMGKRLVLSLEHQ